MSRVLPAATLSLPGLRDLFNAGYSDYLRPLQLDETAFAEHVASNEIDLECSRVSVQSEPVAFADRAARFGRVDRWGGHGSHGPTSGTG